MTLSLHGTNMEDRFEHLPETFNEMMLLPNVPDFCTSHGYLTKIHQIITAGGALLEKEEHHRTKGWTVSLDSTSRHINPPGGMMQHQVFFPVRGVLLFSINRKGVILKRCTRSLSKPRSYEETMRCRFDPAPEPMPAEATHRSAPCCIATHRSRVVDPVPQRLWFTGRRSPQDHR